MGRLQSDPNSRASSKSTARYAAFASIRHGTLLPVPRSVGDLVSRFSIDEDPAALSRALKLGPRHGAREFRLAIYVRLALTFVLSLGVTGLLLGVMPHGGERDWL